MIEDRGEAAQRVLQMVLDGTVKSITGRVIEVCAESICIHGDNPEALAFAVQIRRLLEENGVEIAPLSAVAAEDKKG